MQLYKTIVGDDGDTIVSWQSSADAASKARTALKAEGFVKPSTEAINVPTDKIGLLAWLNENVKC